MKVFYLICQYLVNFKFWDKTKIYSKLPQVKLFDSIKQIQSIYIYIIKIAIKKQKLKVFQMECPNCYLRYTASKRRPLLIPCGHTVCSKCIVDLKECMICRSFIPKNKQHKNNFSLMEIIQKDTKEIDKYIKVCFVGSSTTGKTSLIKRMVGNQFSDQMVTTIGYDFTFQDRIVNNLKVRYQLWDSAGQQKFQAISPIHYKNSDIVVIVYDISKNQKNNNVSYWLNQTHKNCGDNSMVIVVANKLDLVQQNKVCKPVDDEAWKTINEKGFKNFQLSCKTSVGLNQFWQTLDQMFLGKMQERKKNMKNYEKQLKQIEHKRKNNSKIRSSIQKPKQSSSCC